MVTPSCSREWILIRENQFRSVGRKSLRYDNGGSGLVASILSGRET